VGLGLWQQWSNTHLPHFFFEANMSKKKAFSAMAVTLLHNPNCSKSCTALKFLQNAQTMKVNKPLEQLEVREYLDHPLSKAELERLGRAIGASPSEWIRTGESEYVGAGLSGDSSDDDLLAAIESAPILLERPIFVYQGAAVVGRPPVQ
jgi:arsenate reductase